RVPEHMTVLDLQHLAEPAGGFQSTDDSITHLRACERMLHAIEFVGGVQQSALLVPRNPPVTLVLAFRFDLDAESMKRGRDEDRPRPPAAPVHGMPQNAKRPVDGRERAGLAVLTLEVLD